MDEIKITNEEKNIINSAKEVSLSVAEKNEIKNRLISYTNANPISHTVKTKSVPSFFWSKTMYFVPALAMLLLVIGLNTSKNNTTEQIASLETVDTAMQDTVPNPELFNATTLTAPSVESASSFAEPSVAEEPVNTRMMKSSPAPENNAVMMMSATVEVATNTATTTVKSSSSIEKIKEQINTTYKSFISKIFSKNKKEDKKKEEVKEKKDRKSKKEDDKYDDSKSKTTSVINDDKNKVEKEIEKIEIEDSDEDGDDDNKYVIQPLPPVTPPVNTTVTSYTSVDVAKHSVSSDCWSIVSGGVYDLTSWISKHPGGQSAIKGMCGVDATSSFLAQHNGDTKAVNTLSSYKIGILK